MCIDIYKITHSICTSKTCFFSSSSSPVWSVERRRTSCSVVGLNTEWSKGRIVRLVEVRPASILEPSDSGLSIAVDIREVSLCSDLDCVNVETESKVRLYTLEIYSVWQLGEYWATVLRETAYDIDFRKAKFRAQKSVTSDPIGVCQSTAGY